MAVIGLRNKLNVQDAFGSLELVSWSLEFIAKSSKRI